MTHSSLYGRTEHTLTAAQHQQMLCHDLYTPQQQRQNYSASTLVSALNQDASEMDVEVVGRLTPTLELPLMLEAKCTLKRKLGGLGRLPLNLSSGHRWLQRKMAAKLNIADAFFPFLYPVGNADHDRKKFRVDVDCADDEDAETMTDSRQTTDAEDDSIYRESDVSTHEPK